MKKIILLISFIMLIMVSCITKDYEIYAKNNENIEIAYTGQIYLYGEKHGIEKTISREFDIWQKHYSEGMRHLFIETSYFTAQYLNLWMNETTDTRLNEIYSDWEGTATHNDFVLEFYKKIKEYCPETIFHGTDIGHQFYSTGERYLKYLQSKDLTESEEYKITQNVIGQGIFYYDSNFDDVYRENKMVENFIRELSKVEDQDIMGIYGSAHTNINKLDYTRSIPCMANQLNMIFKGQIHSIDLTR